MRMLDICAGRLGWAKAFLARGWHVTAVDLVLPAVIDIPPRCHFLQRNVLSLTAEWIREIGADFICGSTTCDGFASFGMPHFRKNPTHPWKEIQLFEHTQRICLESGVPHVLENVRAAQEFVGQAVNHCGPFYLWGNAVPPILPQGITKLKWYRRPGKPSNFADELNWSKAERAERKAKLATIPPELANCVAEYAERICQGVSA